MAFQARVLTDLQKSVMKIRMVPVEQLFRRVPRVIRDVAKSDGPKSDSAKSDSANTDSNGTETKSEAAAPAS